MHRWIVEQKDELIDGCMHSKYIVGWNDRQMDGQINGLMNGWIDGCMEGLIDGWIDGWIIEQKDGLIMDGRID